MPFILDRKINFFFIGKVSVGSIMGRFVSSNYPNMFTYKIHKERCYSRHFLTYHPKEEKPAILNLKLAKPRRCYCSHLTSVPGRKHYCQKGKKHSYATLSSSELVPCSLLLSRFMCCMHASSFFALHFCLLESKYDITSIH